jgi:purine catabolism regulator
MQSDAPTNFGLTLRELVAVKSLQMRLVVVPENALDTAVNWAHATEMADPRPHLRKSEIVCTVGSVLLTPESCARLVEAVVTTESAGICFGIGEVHTALPSALIEECERRSVALIEMRHGAPFLAINDVLAEHRVQLQLKTSQRDGQLIGSLLVALRENASLEELLTLATEELGGVLSYGSTSTADSAEMDAHEQIAKHGEASDTMVWRGDSPGPDPALLEQLEKIAQVAQRNNLAREAQDRQRVGQLFSLVADGLADSAALIPEFERAGLNDALVTVSAWPAETATLLATLLPTALIADTTQTTFAVALDASDVREAAKILGLVSGHGSPVSVHQIRRGIAEARATFVLARSRGEATGPDGLTSLSGLLHQQSNDVLVPFVDHLVKPIVRHDSTRSSRLLPTLRLFIENHGSLQATASTHFLHVNTVRHRLRRIYEITGRNPLDFDDQTSFAIALWAFDRSESRPNEPVYRI